MEKSEFLRFWKMLKAQGKTEEEMQRTVNMLMNKVKAAQLPAGEGPAL